MAKIAGFNNVKQIKLAGRVYILGYLHHKGRDYSKTFDTPEAAAKWVDLLCLKFNIPQRNNSYKSVNS